MSRGWLFVAACGSAEPTPPPVTSHVDPPPAKVCVDPAADVAKRSQLDAKLDKPYEPVDFDGDGTPDAIYVTAEIGGNRDAYLYASNHGCTQFIGSVRTSFTGLPRCEQPAQSGKICLIASMHYMIHGDVYEYHYTCDGGTCTETGRATMVSPPEKAP